MFFRSSYWWLLTCSLWVCPVIDQPVLSTLISKSSPCSFPHYSAPQLTHQSDLQMVLSAANVSSAQLAPRHWLERAQLPVLCLLSETLDDMFSRSLKHRNKKLSLALKNMTNNGMWCCCLSLILPHAILTHPTAAVYFKDFMHLCTVLLWENKPRKVLTVMLCLWCTKGDGTVTS